MRILLSAHSCEPGRGSESGAGYAAMRAAASLGDVWLLTRRNNVESIERALAADPPPHQVRVVGLDGGPVSLGIKGRTGAHRLYNSFWQRLVARRASELHAEIGFDLAHHATLASYWMPIGILPLDVPVVVQAGGAETVPRSLLPYLGVSETLQQAVRMTARAVVGRRTWKKRSAGQPTILIAQNDDMARFASQGYLASVFDEVFVFPNAADPDLDEWTPGSQPRRPSVLFVGHLGRHKGTHVAVDAFARVQDPDARLTLVGSGTDAALLRRIERLGLADRVELTGRIPRVQVLEEMNQAGVLIAPFLRDSAGFAVSEALSVGLPVVALDHAGPASIARLWPADRSDLVPVGSRRSTIDRLGSALEKRLRDLPPVPTRLEPAGERLLPVLTRAYAVAMDRGSA